MAADHADTIGVLLGSPARNSQLEGKDLFNAVFLLHEKEIKAEIHKTLLPNYDVFDEYRYFEPAYDWQVIEFKGKKLAVTICEDIWNMGDNPLYRVTPMEKLMPFQPDVMINLSASPYNYAQDIVRNSIVKAHALFIVRKLLTEQSNHKGTQVSNALKFFRNSTRQQSIAFILSDFLDANYEDALKVTAKKHDVVGIKVYDKMDMELPKIGMI